MKTRLGCILALALSLTGAHSARADELDIIRDVLGLYDREAREAWGESIGLWIVDSDEVNAFAVMRNERPTLKFMSALLSFYDGDEILMTACHELGHFLGDRTIDNGLSYYGLAVEGEADYFSGACAVRYFREIEGMSERSAIQRTAELARETKSKRSERRLDENTARDWEVAPGVILETHPEPECRVLTIIQGANGLDRPPCWYRP
jgi:hypothetical protein